MNRKAPADLVKITVGMTGSTVGQHHWPDTVIKDSKTAGS